MKNNKGLTLIELLVTITIVLLVGSALLGFLQISTRLYQANDQEVNLQYEAQTVLNKIQNMVIDSTAGISYTVGNDSYNEFVNSDSEFKGTTRTDIELTKKELYIFNIGKDEATEAEKKIVSKVSWDKETKELSYSQYEYKDEAEQKNNTYLLAQYVKEFQLDLSALETSRKLTLTIQMEKGTKSYETSTVVLLRNTVEVNKKAEDIFQGVTGDSSSVTSVSIAPLSAVGMQGSTVQFYSTVLGTFSPSQNVSWTVSGNTDEQTKISPSSGILSLGSKETSQNIQVVATSVKDGTKKSQAASVKTRYFESITASSQTAGQEAKEVQVTATIRGQLLTKEHCDIEWQTSTNSAFTDAEAAAVTDSTEEYDSSNEEGFSTYNNTVTISLSGYPEGSTVYVRAVASKFKELSKGYANGITFKIPVTPTVPTEQAKSIEIKEVKVPDAPSGQCYRGDTVSFSATVKNEKGKVMNGQEISWSLVVKDSQGKVVDKILNQSLSSRVVEFKIPDDGEKIKYENKYFYQVIASVEGTNLQSITILRNIPEVTFSLEKHSKYGTKELYLIYGRSLEYVVSNIQGITKKSAERVCVRTSGEFNIIPELENDTVSITLQDSSYDQGEENVKVSIGSVWREKKITLIKNTIDTYYIPTPSKKVQEYVDLWGNRFIYKQSGNSHNWTITVNNSIVYKYDSNTKKWSQ